MKSLGIDIGSSSAKVLLRSVLIGECMACYQLYGGYPSHPVGQLNQTDFEIGSTSMKVSVRSP